MSGASIVRRAAASDVRVGRRRRRSGGAERAGRGGPARPHRRPPAATRAPRPAVPAAAVSPGRARRAHCPHARRSRAGGMLSTTS